MTTLADIRKKYPTYSDMSDQQLADALYTKSYSDMDRATFNQRIGLQAQSSEADIIADLRARRGDEYTDNLLAQRQQVRAGNPIDLEANRNAALSPMEKFATSRAASSIGGLGQGVSFGFNDELAGGVAGLAAMVPGGRSSAEAYAQTRDSVRAGNEALKDQHPLSYTGGEIGGSLATGGTGLARMGAVKGGAAAGAAYGAGTAEGGLGERAKGAGIGGLLGALGGKATEKVGDGLSAFIQSKAGQRVAGAVPSLDDLRAVKDAAFAKLDDQGIRYTPEQVQDIARAVSGEVPLSGINARDTGAAADVVRRMAQTQDDVSLTQLEDLRSMAFPNKMTASPTELRDSGIVRQNIDEFMEGITPAVGDNAAALASQARQDAGRYIRSRQLNEALEAAKVQASSNRVPDELFSQRKAVAAILKNPNKRRGYSQAEQDAMKRFVEGSAGEKVARQIGKLGSGNVVGTALGSTAGFSMGGPVGALAVPLAAAGIRKSGERATQRNLDELIKLVRSGPTQPVQTPLSQALSDQQIQSLIARAGVVGVQ